MYDILIKAGTIFDGTGNLGFKGDIATVGDRLFVLHGDTSFLSARKIVDASNCIIAPGFIDVHTHSDLMALGAPFNEPKIRQGVTTEIVGLDGLGYAPLSKNDLEMMLIYNSGLDGFPEIKYDWNSTAEYLERFRKNTSGNIAFLLPNSCLRITALGWDKRPADKNEIEQMRQLIKVGMAEGAVGLSTGLSYPPGMWADTNELVELCKTVAECGGVYVTHVRYGLGDGLFDGFREAANIAVRSGCPLHISHYFATPGLRGKTDRLLQFVDDQRARGVDLTFDAYPWEAGSTMLHRVIPQWAHVGGPYELLRRLREKPEREKMLSESYNTLGNVDQMIVSAVKTAKNKCCEGLTIAKVAERVNKSPWDAVCDLLIEEDLQVSFFTFNGDMNDVKTMIQHPAHMFCSDALLIGGKPNPRTYASYPKVLGQLVRDEKVLTMEQAIRKMTSFPSERFGFSSRGILRDNMKADIVIFDPNTVSGVATFDRPTEFPLGIEYVIVNGIIVIENGKHTGELAGVPVAMSGNLRGE